MIISFARTELKIKNDVDFIFNCVKKALKDKNDKMQWF